MLKNISEKDSTSLDNICYLISEVFTPDAIGNEIPTPTETLTYCCETSAYSNEFFNAGKQNIKPSTVLKVDSESYNEQEKAKYNDVVYSIYRTFPLPNGLTELYLTVKVGV